MSASGIDIHGDVTSEPRENTTVELASACFPADWSYCPRCGYELTTIHQSPACMNCGLKIGCCEGA